MTAAGTPLSALLASAGVRAIDPPGSDPPVLRVRVDSRRVEPGDLFCALRGERADGTVFAPEAIARGAVAVLAETPRPDAIEPGVAWVRVAGARDAVGPLARECAGRPDERLVLVGITGTNGKTTVSYMVEAAARAAGRPSGRIGTTGFAYAGVEAPSERTTPEAPDLYDLLATMRDAGTDVVSMEVSSHALALGRVGGARFAVAAFLNLGRDHLDFHRTVEAYFEAKARLFDTLGPDAAAVLPADDGVGVRLAARTPARTTTFGRSPGADVRILVERHDLGGATARLATPAGDVEIRTRLLGRFNILNAAAATACALAIGVPPEAAARGIGALDHVPGRTERVDLGQPFAVVIDFAHTPEALERLLESAREVAPARVLAVFGCGGDRDRGKRAPMGAIAARLADRVVLTSDNPRSEDPSAILDAIADGAAAVAGGADRCRVEPDRAAAIRQAIAEARPGDVVLIAGKGHETTQTVGARVDRFDDRVAAREALRVLGWRGDRRADA